jgi:hypothetical protein
MALTAPAPILRLLPHRPARRAVPQHATTSLAPAAPATATTPVAPAAPATTTPATTTVVPPRPRRTPVLPGTAHEAATAAAAAWPAAARGLLVDLAVAALAAGALAERSDASLLPGASAAPASPVSGSSARRARALAEHLADTCAGLRTDLTVQQLVVLPVLRTAPLGLRTAVVRASCEAVVRELEAVEHGASLLTEGTATCADLRELAAALRRTRTAVALHRRLWTDQALPLAREVLRDRADLSGS